MSDAQHDPAPEDLNAANGPQNAAQARWWARQPPRPVDTALDDHLPGARTVTQRGAK